MDFDNIELLRIFYLKFKMSLLKISDKKQCILSV